MALAAVIWAASFEAPTAAEAQSSESRISRPQAPEPLQIRHFRQADGLPDDRISSITQTFDGLLWLATPSGLTRFDGREWRHLDRRSHPTLADEHLTSLAADRLGYLWVGTQEGGLHRFDGVRFQPVSRPNQVGGPWAVSALHQEQDATLWIGTPDDLLYLEPTASASLYGLPGVRVSDLMQDHHGYMWASAGRGLFRQVQKTFQSITLPLGLETVAIHALVMDTAGRLAVGREDGLLFLEGDFEGTGLPQSYAFEPRFEDQTVRALLTDRADRLVVALDDELWRRDTDGTYARLLPPDTSGDDTSADEGPLGLSAVFEDREGHLWAATRASGLLQIVSPDAAPPPAAHFTGVELDGRPLPPRRQLFMPPEASELSLSFAAPTFEPDRTPQLRYRLEGLEEDWTPYTGGWIRYTQLGPGHYRMLAESSSDGVTWAGAAEMEIFRQPRFHQTASFWVKAVGSVLAVGGLLFGWLWYQRRQVRLLAEMRAQEWRELQEESGLIDGRPDFGEPGDPAPPKS